MTDGARKRSQGPQGNSDARSLLKDVPWWQVEVLWGEQGHYLGKVNVLEHHNKIFDFRAIVMAIAARIRADELEELDEIIRRLVHMDIPDDQIQRTVSETIAKCVVRDVLGS